jgi:FkbM family methyltransferase
LPEGQSIAVDFRDVSAFYWLNYLLGDDFEEEGLLAAVAARMQPNEVVWDVGANCGLFSYRLAKETNAKAILFFEPNPLMFKLAQSAAAPFKKIQGFGWALSQTSGKALLTIPEGGSTTGTLEPKRTDRSGNATEIECKTGDELVLTHVLAPPHIIKIDTEGHEMAVLKGLQSIIQNHKPTIFLEHISMTDEEVSGIIPEGYDIYSVNDRDGALSKGFNRVKGHNSALVPMNTETPT